MPGFFDRYCMTEDAAAAPAGALRAPQDRAKLHVTTYGAYALKPYNI